MRLDEGPEELDKGMVEDGDIVLLSWVWVKILLDTAVDNLLVILVTFTVDDSFLVGISAEE